MEKIVEQLGQYLDSSDERVLEQATEICKSQTAGDQANVLVKLVKPLLRLTSHPNEIVSDNAVVSLINLTSIEPLASMEIIKENGVSRLLDSVIGPESNNIAHRLMLLTNLTSADEKASDQLLDLNDEDLKGQRLLRLAVRFTLPVDSIEIKRATSHKGLPIITSNDDDQYEYAAMVLMNATQNQAGRQIFFDTPDFFMPALLQSLSSESVIRKQGIIGVLRNLCFESEKHEFLLTKANILPYIVKPLFTKAVEENMNEASLIRSAFPGLIFGNHIEPISANRLHLLETIWLLTQSEFGLSYLRQHSVVIVMRELDEFETDEENKQLGYRISHLLLGPEPEAEEQPKQPDVHATTEIPGID